VESIMDVRLLRSILAASVAAVATLIAGCGGGTGDTGPQGEQGPPGQTGQPGQPGAPGVSGTSAVNMTRSTNPTVIAANAAVWETLEPTITVTGVTIASPPVVRFTVADPFGKPVVGLGNTSKSATAKLAGNPNLSFTLSKLVRGVNGSANTSKWVSYMVTAVPTTDPKSVCTTDPNLGCPGRPTSDNTGTLVDNGDGSYEYTFWRDVRQAGAQVAAMAASAAAYDSKNKVVDLGDLTFADTAVHRLTIQLSGAAPGTGTNTPDATASSIAEVLMKKPYNAIYDFIPATGQKVTDSGREIVATKNCENCHRKLLGIPGLSAAEDSALVHGGGRNNTQYCVNCHTDQRKYGRAESTYKAGDPMTFDVATQRVDGRALFNLPNMIHKFHAGPLMAKKTYNPDFSETTYPQDIRNCTSCHAGPSANTPARIAKTTDGDNWKKVPSILACGACHDGIDFATGGGMTLGTAAICRANASDPLCVTSPTAHQGGAQADDSQCATCHKPGVFSGATDIDLVHAPVTPPAADNSLMVTGGNTNANAAWIASGASAGRLPADAIAVTYEIKSVSRNASQQPVMVFRMLQNGKAVDLNVFATATPNPATGDKEIWDNFMGAPSVYFVFAVPQDNIAAPADFNVSVNGWLKRIWQGGTGAPGTLTGPDVAGGYYTVTLTNVTVPDSAVMLTGGLGYSYSLSNALPLTQTNLADYPVTTGTAVPTPTFKAGGLIVIAPNAQKVATAGCVGGQAAGCANVGSSSAPNYIGYNARRPIVEDARCNACHQELGTFTEDAFHGGQRNDGTTCSWCHNPNRAGSGSGWSADSTAFIHAVHASAKRQKKYTWHASSTTEGFWDITYPGILNDCQTCHAPGTYDFSASASASAAGLVDGNDRRTFRTVATGRYALTAGATTTTYTGAACTPGTSSAQTELGAFSIAPFLLTASNNVSDINYGIGFAYNAGLTASTGCRPDGTPYSNPPGGTIAADGATLVTSPTVSVCSACHDSDDAISHFKLNGAAWYEPRSTALSKTNETCLLCHGTGRIADINVMHSKNR